MRLHSTIPAVCMVSLMLFGFAISAHQWGNSHMRRMIGRQDVSQTTCYHCHLVSTNRLAWARPRPHHDSPAGLAVSPDGTKLYIALDDRDEVVEADVLSRKLLRRIEVTGTPFGLAMDTGGRQLFVACRNGNRVAVIDARTFHESESVVVGQAPVAVAYQSTSVGARLVVANSGSDDISLVSVSPLRELNRVSAGREPFAVAAAPGGSLAVVVNRLANLATAGNTPASELTVVDPATTRVIQRMQLESAHLSEGVCSVGSHRWALTPLVKVRNAVPITQVANGWVMSSGLGIADLRSGEVVQLPLDESHEYFADPSGIVVDPAGKRAFVASGGADVVTVLDLSRMADWLAKADKRAQQEAIYDLALSPEYVLGRIRTGRNPRHLAITPDGGTLFVAEHLEDSILVVDTESLRPLGRIVLGNGGLGDPIRRGERVFTTAAYTFQHQFSCRSCHPDGHVDGLSYDFDGDGIGDNLLDNRSLQGVAGTEPFKWNGKNPSLEIQCGPRFAKVLMRTEPFPQEQLKDLTAFIESLPPARRTTDSETKLNPAQERGRAIFFASRTPEGTAIPRDRQCPTCHRPPLYTVRLSFNVGTRTPYDTSELFDTPQLLGIAASAPYLHDGRAQSLEELWTVYNPNDRHGVSSYMNKSQLNDLIEFLKTL